MRPRSSPAHLSWLVRSTHCTSGERAEVLAIFESTKYGGGAFLWTPPGGVEERVRFAESSLTITQETAAKRYAITARLERV